MTLHVADDLSAPLHNSANPYDNPLGPKIEWAGSIEAIDRPKDVISPHEASNMEALGAVHGDRSVWIPSVCRICPSLGGPGENTSQRKSMEW